MRTFTTRSVTTAFLIIAACSPSLGIEADQVRNCFNLTPDQFSIDASVDLEISVAAGQVTSVEVTRYTPDTEEGYGIARAAYRAAMMCGPYVGETGTFSITLPGKTASEPGGIPLPGTQ
jgi:hypothetical protein